MAELAKQIHCETAGQFLREHVVLGANELRLRQVLDDVPLILELCLTLVEDVVFFTVDGPGHLELLPDRIQVIIQVFLRIERELAVNANLRGQI